MVLRNVLCCSYRERILRVLSRIFCGLLFAVTLLFAGVAPSFASEEQQCLDAGWTWDSKNQQCCWLYSQNAKGEVICVNGTNWNSLGLNSCPEGAAYIDLSGDVKCCPNGTGNSTTHQCECQDGFFNVATGNCATLKLARSPWCDIWGKGYFFHYLLKNNWNNLSGLAAYQSPYTCAQLIEDIDRGSDLLVADADGCTCSCKDPALTFNPGAAIACRESHTDCDNICVDLNRGKNDCPLGQRQYYINGQWQCCIFYDPERNLCIDTDQAWVNYVGTLGNDFKGGGYVGPDGLPTPCPNGVEVDSHTGRCICTGGGWFDTTAGVCMETLPIKTHHNPGGAMRTIYRNMTPASVPSEMATEDGFFETANHKVYRADGAYVYTTLASNAQFSTATDYVSTNPQLPGVVEAWYYVTLTLKNNDGTQNQQITRLRVGGSSNAFSPAVSDPSRTGYQFNGWWTSASGGTQVAANILSLQGYASSTATYYAHWTGNSYSIHFRNDNCPGTRGGSMSDQSMTYGTAANLTSNAFTCTGGNGYTFQGWSRTSGGSASYADGVSVNNLTNTQNGTVDLYAVWTANNPSNVTVTLDLNNAASGTTCSAGAHTVAYNGSYTLPSWDSSSCNITNGNKVFVGWTETAPSSSNNYLDTGSVAVTPAGFQLTNLTANHTYYAVWRTPTCTVQNGSGEITTPSNNTPRCVVTCNSGYGTNGTYSGNAGTASVSYICANRCYQISLNNSANGGSGGTPTTLYLFKDTTASPNHCKLYTNSNCSTEVNVTASGNVYVVPTTEPTKTHATYTGYGADWHRYQNYGTNYGWSECLYNGSNYGISSMGFDATQTPALTLNANYSCDEGWRGNCTLYDHYDGTADCYGSGACTASTTTTISFNQNGGSGGRSTSVSATYGSLVPVITTSNWTTPSKWGYTFRGYSDSQSSGGTLYYYGTGAPVKVWDKTSSTTTLYADWSLFDLGKLEIYEYDGTHRYQVPCVRSSCTLPTYSAAGVTQPTGGTWLGWAFLCGSTTEYCGTGDANATDTGLYGTSTGAQTVSNNNAFFGRWNVDAMDNNFYDGLHPCWGFNITYTLNGGSNPSGTATSYNSCLGATLPTPTLSGSDFGGWYDNSSFTGSPVTTIPAGTTGARTYYAKWIQNAVACNAGYYLPANSTSASDCTQCPAGSYCPAASHALNANADHGKYTCPARQSDDLGNSSATVTSPAGSDEVTDCYIQWLPDGCAEYVNNINYGGGVNITTPHYSELVKVYAQNDGTGGQDAYPTDSRYIYPAKLYSLPGYGVVEDASYNGQSNVVTIPELSQTGYKGLYGIVGKSCSACTGNNYARGGGQVKWQAANNVGMNIGHGLCTSCASTYTITGNAASNHDNPDDCKVTCGAGRAVQTAGEQCTAVGITHWAPGGQVSQGSTSGNIGTCGSMTGLDGVTKQLYTTGDGVGADEAADCGLEFHVGTDVLRLRSGKKTTPSVNFDYTGNGSADLYLNMSTTASPMASDKNFKMNYNGSTYYVCDDTTCQ